MRSEKVHFTTEKETMLMTLYGRALQSRSKDPILQDKWAEDAVNRIDYDFGKLKMREHRTLLIAIRAKQLDLWTTRYLADHPNATVLHLGCGLDSRIYRIDPPASVRWFDVDYPEVIELRRRLYPERAGYRMSAPLCNAVTGQNDGQMMLEHLERANLFLVSLDDECHWYRYHPLFAEVLRHRLRQEQPELLPELHRRASVWYEHNGWADAGIEHALAAGDFERAAKLIEQVAEATWIHREPATLLRWLDALPDDLVRSRPHLSLSYARTLLFVGQFDAVEARLQDVECGFDASVADRAEVRDLVGRIAAIRSLVACYQGEPSRAVTLSRQALAFLPPDNLLVRAGVAINLALNLADAYRASADGAEANRILAEAAEITQAPGNVPAALPVLNLLGELETAQGKLRQARETYGRALQLASEYQEQSRAGSRCRLPVQPMWAWQSCCANGTNWMRRHPRRQQA
ncbi:MAG TPA: hypothetical protein DEP84_36685 [Chloroflexi bacterium]|nr:hypothetical protein [Chloroflexota bacterium]